MVNANLGIRAPQKRDRAGRGWRGRSCPKGPAQGAPNEISIAALSTRTQQRRNLADAQKCWRRRCLHLCEQVAVTNSHISQIAAEFPPADIRRRKPGMSQRRYCARSRRAHA